jgi:diguanylate cyclase (GGDEF)-like protein/PAS domain S-box-containing protein
MSKTSILIVEDESIIAMDIQNRLEKNGYQIAGRADRGVDAIMKAETLHPDLILMDIGLKGAMDGIEAASQIRVKFDIPVVFLTAFANQTTVERARLAEPFGYILKPFEERELTIVIEMALYRHDMERRLRESENKFHNVIEYASDGIALIDSQGVVIEWNPALEQITGLQRSETLGQAIWKITFQMLPKEAKTPEAEQDHDQKWSEAIKDGYADKIGMIEREIETPQGVRRTVQSNGFTLETSQGLLAGVIMRDITQRKLLEQSERDQRLLAEALRDTALILNSTLNLDDVLDRILDNISKLVKYDAAMVSLIEGDVVRKIRYHHGAEDSTDHLPIGDMHVNLLNIPILKTIIKTKQPCLIPDIQKDARWQVVAIPGMQRVHSFICAPIVIQGDVAGVVNVISGTPDFFTPMHTESIAAFTSQAAVAMENAQLFEKANRLSLTDPLTELFNRRYFIDFASLEFERVRRYARTLSVAMVDVDHFKSVNDSHGHHIGDITLREIALRIKNSVRAVDVVARYGGEEFVILMPETGIDEAIQVAERVRQVIAGSPIENEDVAVSVTLSLGIVELDKNTNNLAELIKCADQALYKAKAGGRNRVEGYVAER